MVVWKEDRLPGPAEVERPVRRILQCPGGSGRGGSGQLGRPRRRQAPGQSGGSARAPGPPGTLGSRLGAGQDPITFEMPIAPQMEEAAGQGCHTGSGTGSQVVLCGQGGPSLHSWWEVGWGARGAWGRRRVPRRRKYHTHGFCLLLDARA